MNVKNRKFLDQAWPKEKISEKEDRYEEIMQNVKQRRDKKYDNGVKRIE